METQKSNSKKNRTKKFKSYYVVWKPGRLTPLNFPSREFKSYYVVWKLFLSKRIKKKKQSLNRTMQYGN